MSKNKKPQVVYLAQLDVFGYELTVIGETREECLKALKKEYLAGRKARGAPTDDHGALRSFPSYVEYAGISITEMPFGTVDWL